MPGQLYICATPIGNLSDITLRVIETLKTVDLIAAEDTRHTKILLSRYNIENNLISYHKFNKEQQAGRIILDILSGKNVALVSDAGTPGISDPGQKLICLAIKENIQVISIPGPSAIISGLIVSGFNIGQFLFVGFLPKKQKEKTDLLKEIIAQGKTFVFYESPMRVRASLESLAEVDPKAKVSVARELTKKFEEIMRGGVLEVLELFEKQDKKGEFVIVVQPSSKKTNAEIDLEKITDLAKQSVAGGLSVRDASHIFAGFFGIHKKDLYKKLL